MKRRHRYLLNIFSISLLSGALYLNFVRKEEADFSAPPIENTADKSTNPDNKEAKNLPAKQSGQVTVLK